MAMYLYEFLYRGSPQSTGGEPTFHVVLAEDGGTDSFGNKRPDSLSGALTPAQAEALGFPFPKLLETINTAALNRIAELETQLGASKPPA